MKVELNGEEWATVIECVYRVQRTKEESGLNGCASDLNALWVKMSEQLGNQK